MSKTPFQFTVSQYIVALALALAQVRIKTKANTFLSQILTQLPRSSLLPIHLNKSTRQHVKWSHRFSFAALKWLSRFSLAVVVEVFFGSGCRAQVFLGSSEVVVDVFIGSGCPAQVFLGSSHSRLTPLFTSGGAESQFGQTVSALFPTIAPQLLLCSV